ncbi:MAG: response regulator [Flammeovirgaceae bacterium]
MTYTILHADDHPISRMGIRTTINQLPNYELIEEEIEDGDRAMLMARHYEPDMILLDLEMPKSNGMEVAKYIFDNHLNTKVILLSGLINTAVYQQGKSLGVKGFVLKIAAISEIEECLVAIQHGEEYISKDLARSIGADLVLQQGNPFEHNILISTLTKRELAVLQLVIAGYTSAEIANKLFNSLKTIETHRHNISKKFNLNGQRLSSYITKNKEHLERALQLRQHEHCL